MYAGEREDPKTLQLIVVMCIVLSIVLCRGPIRYRSFLDPAGLRKTGMIKTGVFLI